MAALNASTGSNRLFYHSDRLSSVNGLTNQGGTLIEGYMYDPYGKQTVIVNPVLGGPVDFSGSDMWTVGGASTVYNTNMFTGQRFDAETGLDYYKARYYQVDLGRFISRDPAKADSNLYRYVGNGPTDEDGSNGPPRWSYCHLQLKWYGEDFLGGIMDLQCS